MSDVDPTSQVIGTALGGSRTKPLVKSTDLEVIRLLIPAGKLIPEADAVVRRQ